MKKNQFTKYMLLLIMLCAVGILIYYTLNIPEKRSTTKKLDDAVNELNTGAKKAGRQLEDRTPAEKLEDTVEYAKDKVKDSE